jgi:hypothetical protein
LAIATTQQRSSKPSLPAISTSTRHPNAGNNLNQQLDQIAQSLAPSNIKDAAQKTADLLQQLDGPKKGGRVSSAETRFTHGSAAAARCTVARRARATPLTRPRVEPRLPESQAQPFGGRKLVCGEAF